MYPWLVRAADNGTVIVAASRRLARDLLRCYAEHQQLSGVETWHTPAIGFWSDWLVELFESADLSAARPTRIDHNAATILWERCLAAHGSDQLLGFAGAVRQSRQAWQRLQDWNVSVEELLRSSRSADQQLFARAARAYQELLIQNNWIDPARLPAAVADALPSNQIVLPHRVMFAGFDRAAPVVERIMDRLRERGCAVESAPVEKYGGELHGQPCQNRQQEFRSAGLWARNYLTRHPDARIAIVCPDLDADAPVATRLLREGLAPGWQYADEAARASVNVSYGRRLSDFPAVAVALLVLRWINDGLSSREVSILLRSPFLAGQRTSGRSRFELELRRWPDRSWTAASLASLLRGQDQSDDCREWLQFVDRVVALRLEYRAHASPSKWAEIFDRFLDEIGWPGEATRDSAAFQLLERWRSLLGELAATGMVTSGLSMPAAIERLRTMAMEVVFQPESSPGIVQLLGMLEASGLTFDAVWICGLDATRWPPPPNPLALVSRQLQEKHGMPDATPADSLAFAEAVLQGIADSARTVVMSWPRAEGDVLLSPSPLLANFSLTITDSHLDPSWHASSFQDPEMIAILDADSAPAVESPEAVSGGAYTIQMQTVDPFSAFAQGRLGIKDLPRFESGLPAALKGSIAHRVLHALLADRPDRDAIAQWSESELTARIENALARVFASSNRHLNPVHQQLMEFERLRLGNMLRVFVGAELDRPPFAVECVEQRFDFERLGMQFGLRVDRIDRLADNTLLILDYKTGAAKSLLNRDGELSDLQLVVYAMAIAGAIDGDIGGLALVNIDSRGVSYKGTGGSVEWDARRRDDWPQRLASWIDAAEIALTSLARGDARLNMQLPDSHSRPLALLSRIGHLRHE